MVTRLASFDKDFPATAKASINRATLPPKGGLVAAFFEFANALTLPASRSAQPRPRPSLQRPDATSSTTWAGTSKRRRPDSPAAGWGRSAECRFCSCTGPRHPQLLGSTLHPGACRGGGVILFDKIDIGYTEGGPLTTVDGFADGAAEIIEALELSQVDLLGWSFGGVVARKTALKHPNLFRKLVEAGSGSDTAPGMPAMPQRVATIMTRPDSDLEDLLYLLYPETDNALTSGLDTFERIKAEMPVCAPRVTQHAAMGQLEAITAALAPSWDDVARDLATITAPVLYVGGAHDVMIDPYSSYAAIQVSPTAKLVLCSDTGHAFLFQHIDNFVREVVAFLAD